MIAEARQAVYTLVESTWSDITNIIAEEDANRFAWLKAISENVAGWTIPFAVVSFGRASESQDWGICNKVYEVPLTLTLVNTSSMNAKAQDDYFGGKLEAMAIALRAYTGDAFQVYGLPSTDDSPMSEANKILVAGGLHYISGQVDARLIVGEGA